jgi:hypothetical protein
MDHKINDSNNTWFYNINILLLYNKIVLDYTIRNKTNVMTNDVYQLAE